MKTISLVAKLNQPEAVAVARQLAQAHPERTFLAEPHLAGPLGWSPCPEEELGARAEAMVVLGGDGTLIQAARILRGRAVPLLGINLGSLGFMTEFPKESALEAVDLLLAGKATIDSRMKLSCRLVREGKSIVEDEVLNDVVIAKSALARIADHETWLADEFVALFKADGLIFSTPTGSTAYSLSAGGSIVHPSVDCVVVTPISPHSLTQRPIVVPAERKLKVVLKSETADVYLTLDGKAGHELRAGDRIEVEKSPNRVLLVRNSKLGYFGVLRQKLRWGER
ncbi:MAG: NAD(+)/NADH kinase [Myxococcaceae bacterium]